MKRAIIGLLLLALSGCTQLLSPTQPCSEPADCPLPLVCCTGGFYLSLNELSGPTCGTRSDCPGDFLPFLPEGTPCGRAPAVTGETCHSELVCCDRTLTCATAAACAAAPAPATTTPPADLSCSADGDCPSGSVCCGIDFQHRAGTCSDLTACAAGQGIVVTRPDGGVVDAPDGGSAPDLVDQICAEAYCDASGRRDPSAEERTTCAAAFRAGTLTAGPACLDAVRASRTYCGHVLRPRGAVSTPVVPVLPAACRGGASASDPDAVAACAALARCGHLGTTTPEACALHLAGLGYDALSRIAETTGCTWPSARLGWAAPTASSRCRADGDCPTGHACTAADSSHGLCVRSCQRDSDCGARARCLGRSCYDTCDPLLEDDRPAVEAQCNARIVLDGPPELACAYTVATGGQVVGACTAVPPPGQCPSGPEPLRVGGAGRAALGFECATSTVGTVARHQRCSPVIPDECAASACVPINGGVCSDPCVASPFAPPCPNGETCVVDDRGWGRVGACM